jgi:hypothetical protein
MFHCNCVHPNNRLISIPKYLCLFSVKSENEFGKEKIEKIKEKAR